MQKNESIVVLTIPERADIFRSVIGEEADFKFNSMFTTPLDEFLVSVSEACGETVVIDEGHFLSPDDLHAGLKNIVDSIDSAMRFPRIIAVCPRRKAGDALLDFLVNYCQIYDVIYDVSSVDIAVRLSRLLDAPQTRKDIMELIDDQYERGISKQWTPALVEKALDPCQLLPKKDLDYRIAGDGEAITVDIRIHLEDLLPHLKNAI